MTDYFTLMAYRVTSWISYQQKTVALSSTKAEYIVFSNCGHQLIWIRNCYNLKLELRLYLDKDLREDMG